MLTSVTVKDSTNATSSPVTYSIPVDNAGSQVSGQIFLNSGCNGTNNPPTMAVSINTSPVETTTTDTNGNYSFATVPNGRPTFVHPCARRQGAAFVNLPKDIMEGEARCEVLEVHESPNFGPGSGESLADAAKLINGAVRPVILLGLLASRPGNADAARAFIRKSGIPVVGTFQAAGAVSADLFNRFAGRVGQLDNTPGDELLASADVI